MTQAATTYPDRIKFNDKAKTMTPEAILAIAERPTTRAFNFGSQELADWNNEHCFRGQCHQASGWYVVSHRSPGMPTFRVLSMWSYGQRCPISHDVPLQAALAG